MRINLHPVVYFLSVVIIGGCSSQVSKEQKTTILKDSGNLVHADTSPASLVRPDTSRDPRYLQALRFLATIRKADAEKMGQDAYFRQFPGYNVDSFLGYFSKVKFSISDMEQGPNDDQPYSMEKLKKELTRRKGPAFEILAQMGYIYSLPYPQYSSTDFNVSPDSTGIEVNMAGNYLLTFAKQENGEYKLTKVESEHISDK